MEPQELRIGNLLQSDINGDFDSHILVVNKIDENIGAKSLFDNMPVYWGIENFKPIPLTEDILVNWCGFKEDKKHGLLIGLTEDYHLNLSPNLFSGNLNNPPNWLISILYISGNQQLTFFKKYLHELQNIYLDLAGKKLNITINKVH